MALSKLPLEPVLLGPADELRDQFPRAEVIPYSAPLLSVQDLEGLSPLLSNLSIDCFIAPQFYSSPWTQCPQVRILHDTFPFEAQAKLPSASDAASAFGAANLRAVSATLTGTLPSDDERVWAQSLYRAYYDLAVENAATILTVSASSRLSLEQHFPKTVGKIDVLPLAPDPDLTGGPRTPVAERPYDVMHISKFEPRKNQLKLLQAWQLLSHTVEGFRACFVGSPSSLFREYGAEVVQGVESARNAGWLEYHHSIDDLDLGKLYRASKILCAPSTAEGFGLPALEGLANGCALVALAGTAIDDICGDHVTHVADSVRAIASGVSGLLADQPLLDRKSVSACDYTAGFTLDRTAQSLMQAIRHALAGPVDLEPVVSA
ncbi:glycosyltransferase [Gordonia terrae]|uniref:glycosyltransferase n=1 Tax=Gordonia terrae TaxID=2055 RepID=UPI0015DFD96C|nr:glycosyltransferase [Gordonia terrae]